MHSEERHTRRNRPLAVMLVLALSAGCNGAVRESGLVPVSGRVTLDGGPWPKDGVITFGPVSAENTSRPTSATFDTSGNFTVMSFDNSPGLYPGTYNVGVECWEEPPGMNEKGKPTVGKGPVPKKYRNGATSGLKLTVEAGSTPDANFDVKSK